MLVFLMYKAFCIASVAFCAPEHGDGSTSFHSAHHDGGFVIEKRNYLIRGCLYFKAWLLYL